MNLALPVADLISLLLCSVRIGAWVMIAPPIATAGVPKRIKVILSVALAMPVMTIARDHVPSPEIGPLVDSIAVQLLIGAGLGFLTRILFTAIEAAGSLIDLFGGFSAAFSYDPFTTSQNSVMGRFFAMMATTLIFATNAHLLIFQGFLRTFTAIPLDGGIALNHLGSTLTHALTNMFIAALQVAAPLIAVLFMTDIALGLVSRISPQLNVFQLSFPLKIILTLGLIGLGFALLPRVVTDLSSTSARFMAGFGGG